MFAEDAGLDGKVTRGIPGILSLGPFEVPYITLICARAMRTVRYASLPLFYGWATNKYGTQSKPQGAM